MEKDKQPQDAMASNIRSRIEENALQDCLKSTMGGYTKKSVQEYTARLRSQQQLVSENFNRELHRVLDEKEQLSQENTRLNEQLDQLTAEHRELTEAVTSYQVEGADITMDDVLHLKSSLEALEREKAGLQSELRKKELEIGQLQNAVKEQTDAVERAKLETRTCQELLNSEKQECSAQRHQVSELSTKLDEQRTQLHYLNGIVSEGNVAELNASIESLTKNSALQEQLLGKKSEQLAALQTQNQTLSGQLGGLRESAAQLTQNLDRMMLQNEKLAASNQALQEQLSLAQEQSVSLLSEKAQLNVEKLLSERKLEAALRKLSDQQAGIR